MAAFWSTEEFTNDIVRNWNLDNFRTIFDQDVYRDVAWRTIKMAALVTVADAVLAFPIAYYMARIASPRMRDLLVVAVLTPLWASYLVKAFAWQCDARRRGASSTGCSARSDLDPPGDWTGLWLTFTYFWLPFMILPIYAGLERIPLVAARGVIRSRRTFRAHVLEGDASARVSGRRRRLDLHVLAHARRLHPPGAHRRPAVHRHGHLRRPQLATCRSRPRSRWCRSPS